MTSEGLVFEDEVRRVARLLWPQAAFGGARIMEGKERDGVFVTEGCIHLLEATTSRQKDKAVRDARKLASLAQKVQRQHPTLAVKCWFVTRQEPTADQREAVTRYQGLVAAISFSQFQSMLIDSRSYLDARDRYYFGSVRDPKTGSPNPSTQYVPLDLLEIESDKLWSISEVVDCLLTGRHVILLGDYGAGKSMSLREVYSALRKLHIKGRRPLFPVYINLRDHHGQTNPAEVLERHARNIGFPDPSHLVRAWRAGYAVLLLDGFDEIATLGWVGIWKKLRDVRHRSMEVIRRFVRETPPETGLALAGRAHFFDGEREMASALATNSTFLQLTLSDFTDEQVGRYLKKSGFNERVPGWIPTRPLLLGSLVARGLLQELVQAEMPDKDGVTDPVVGWNLLLDRITIRESEIEAGIDGETVRKILERLATKARATADGLGPLTTDTIISAFSETCGYRPDARGMVLLQRLPGLGIDQEEEGTRRFIDEDLADTCRAGDVVAFATDPFNFEADVFSDADFTMQSLGVSVAAHQLSTRGYPAGKLEVALRKATELDDREVLAADLVRVAIERQFDVLSNVRISNVFVSQIELPRSIGDLSRVQFEDCYFSHLGIDPEANAARFPRFRNCFFSEVDACISESDLPPGVFLGECVFESFLQTADTTNSILDLDLPLGTKVTLTVLKKLYLQRGSARRENALYRGLDHRGRRLVPDVLELLQQEGLAVKFRRGATEALWLPSRSESARVHRMIAGPSVSQDPVIKRSKYIE